MIHRHTSRRPSVVFVSLVLVSCICALTVLALCIGEVSVAPGRLPGLLLRGAGSTLEVTIVRDLRLPRVLLALLAGVALGTAGIVLQDLTGNPLASPDLLGVSSGASFMMATILVIGVPVPFALHSLLALAGGLTGFALVLVITRTSGPAASALGGALTAALLNAGTIVVISLAASTGSVQLLFLYTVGDLANRTWSHVYLAVFTVLPMLPITLITARQVTIAQLGESLGRSLGVRINRLRALLFIVCAALVAGVVAVCGPVAWIGLLAPHLARLMIATTDTRKTLPMAALTGAVLLLAADVFARVLVAPSQLPVGLCTTLIAGPVILFLLRKQRPIGLKRVRNR